jgi:tripartite-type tricarboxylate transporter receptor subunit TctC
VLIVANSFLINPALKKLAYDPLTSFEPLCLLTRSPNVIAVNSASPYHSLSDLLNDAQAKPGGLTLAFQGPATSQHIAAEKLKLAAKIDMINVPFTGAAPAVNALLGSHVAALFINYPSVAEQARAGKVRILAAGTRDRNKLISDIPTIAEAIHNEFEEDVWFGAVVPANTPKDAVENLSAWFRQAMADTEVDAKLAIQGFARSETCGDAFASYLRQYSDEYHRLIHDANIKLE